MAALPLLTTRRLLGACWELREATGRSIIRKLVVDCRHARTAYGPTGVGNDQKVARNVSMFT